MKLAVVTQTHWDREWYYPHQQYVARLLVVMERVVKQLESGQLESFLFDGQTAAFEDLLANAEPVLAEKVQKLVREKRIVLGPWYVMADEFLVSGESLLRNLEIGIADATKAGNCQRVGYLPDTFGHVSQMPQLLREFGIDSAVMWRGVDSPHSEFNWRSPDGSVVGSVFLTQGYYQHPFNVADWKAALVNYLKQIAPRALSENLLLTQGGDHLVSSAELKNRIAEFNQSQQEFAAVQSSLEGYTNAALAESAGKRKTITGELRNNAQAFVLPDVLSTRRYLKLANQLAEDRLTGVVEPLFAMLNIAQPKKYLEQCWRLLIQNQAHDSICGCSVDSVHREMLTRYAQLDQRMNALIERASAEAGMISVAQHGAANDVFADDSTFTLFNPHPKRFRGWHTQRVFIKGDVRQGLTVKSSNGAVFQAEVLHIAPSAAFRSPIDDFPDRIAGHVYEVAIECEVAGLSALQCEVAFTAKTAPTIVNATVIENAHLRLALAEGTLNLTDKASGITTDTFLSVLSELDAGDTYNYSPPPHPHQVVEKKFSFVSVSHREAVQELVVSIEMTVPASLSDDRSVRSAQTAINHGELRMRLFPDQRAIDCQLQWHNAARDQRTRLLIPVANHIEASYSDSAFGWEKLPVVFANYPKEISRREMPIAVMPSQSAIVAGNIGFAHRAMQEYEIIERDGARFLGVTLVRSVGWMSRRDLVTRGVGAGPDMETPEAQCMGNETFQFRIGLLGDDHVAWLNDAAWMRKPPVLLRGHGAKWRDGCEFNAALQVSAVRRVGDELEVRLWNPTPTTQTLAGTRAGWRRVHADGRSCTMTSDAVAAYQIVTLRCPL